jgi:hypothetical protein
VTAVQLAEQFRLGRRPRGQLGVGHVSAKESLDQVLAGFHEVCDSTRKSVASRGGDAAARALVW